MAKFSKRSLEQLATCHPDIQLVMNEVIKIYNFTVTEGLRLDERQSELFNKGFSKLDGTIGHRSKHQDRGDHVSHAVDIAPYPLDYSQKFKAKARCYYLAGLVRATAIRLYEENLISSSFRWGGDWDSDDEYTDQNFDDIFHWEII